MSRRAKGRNLSTMLPVFDTYLFQLATNSIGEVEESDDEHGGVATPRTDDESEHGEPGSAVVAVNANISELDHHDVPFV